ncbi:response regulator [Sphingomonas sp.]|jgi:signal transduction histidine kinase/ActR/RegA family two-component response regulator|uniref:response regulator n=1 Tax=Sphingomonas sp. TaxID=28214 RepID=UPI002DEE157F|nr:response regulator [Sphingomonas sp.]HEV2567802.1 response regulator [Sphingomonas sp.]
MEWLTDFIDAGRKFAPHGYCLLWRPELVWTHVIGDALIAAAYFSIPVALISFIRRRRDLEFSWIFWLFATFIVACGVTHLMAIWTLWNADYGVEAVIKIVTAIASVGTAIVLWPLIPRLLAIPSPLQLREQNAHLETTLQQLTHEMSERRRAEEALRQAQKMEAVGQLTGGIAHDFNNLLQSVSGSLALIASNPGSDKVARWADLGRQAAERGARLTAQLLAFSRTQKLELRPCPVAELLEGMNELLSSAVGSATTIRMELDGARGAQVLGDPTQIELAIMNLVINARDAMPDGGTIFVRTKPVQVHNDVELADGSYLCIEVVDSGLGMSPDVAARAFDPFFTTKPVGKGTGLGLSMVYGVARQSGGRAGIRSEAGKGTTVSILLPLVDQAGAAAPDRPVTPALQEPKTILVIDDDPDVRLLTLSMLEELGHRTVEASSGPAALALLPTVRPDLILLDFAMPEMNGAQVATEIRARGGTAPIVFATGFADSEAIQKALVEEPHLLRKPYDLAQLSAMLNQALQSADRAD